MWGDPGQLYAGSMGIAAQMAKASAQVLKWLKYRLKED